MYPLPEISFDDTAVAFDYKSTADLRKANLIFSLVNYPWLSSVATSVTAWALKAGLPIEGLIRRTAFDHFCGGEGIVESERVIQQLNRYGVGTILDYSVEGEKSERGFDRTQEEVMRTIEKAHHSSGIPFCVFKVTGVAPADVLEKLNKKEALSAAEAEAFDRASRRVDAICAKAHAYGLPVLIDAEETWIQDPIDHLADKMMARYNKQSAIVWNTYQMYRTSSMVNLVGDFQDAVAGDYFLGAKLVRGAYMEKERDRAEAERYASPIHVDKEATDHAFNDALLFCLDHIDHINVMCGSHNEVSSTLLAKGMAERDLLPSDKRIWFAQLYGMSDHISFNLAKEGYNVAKYVPYGPVKAVMPYLLRRAEENTSVAGQSSRELTLIRAELKRRRRVR